MLDILVDNENFNESILALLSKGFIQDTKYIFLYDSLKSANQQQILKHDLPKDRILIRIVKGEKHPKEMLSKYRSRLDIVESTEIKIDKVLNDIFRGVRNKDDLVKELSNFESRYILNWLESIAITNYKVAQTMSELDKYVYGKIFPYVVVYNLYGCQAIAKYTKKEKI